MINLINWLKNAKPGQAYPKSAGFREFGDEIEMLLMRLKAVELKLEESDVMITKGSGKVTFFGGFEDGGMVPTMAAEADSLTDLHAGKGSSMVFITEGLGETKNTVAVEEMYKAMKTLQAKLDKNNKQ